MEWRYLPQMYSPQAEAEGETMTITGSVPELKSLAASKRENAAALAHRLLRENLYWGVTISDLIGEKQSDIVAQFEGDLIKAIENIQREASGTAREAPSTNRDDGARASNVGPQAAPQSSLIQALTEALQKYGYHHADCQINWQPNPSCTCGLAVAIAQAEAQMKETENE